MRPVYLTTAFAAADADGIAQAQTPVGAGNLTLNGALVAGGVATLNGTGLARQVAIASDGNDSGVTFTVYGTDANGATFSEALTGPNTATVVTVNYFQTVTRVAISAAGTGLIIVGTNGVGASKWVPVDYINAWFGVGFGCVVSGTVNYTMQHTFADLFDATAAASAVPFNHPFVAAQTANADGNYAYPIRGMRLRINSGTGSVATTILQGLTA